jgi:hypothetical protein
MASAAAASTVAAVRDRAPRAASRVSSALQASGRDAMLPDASIDLAEADAVVLDAVRRVESGIVARSAGPDSRPASVPPQQQGSPVATPSAGVSGTITG